MDVGKVGKFLLDLRKKNGLTQQQMAFRLGVSYQAVSKWENGKNVPDIAIMKKISEEFHVDITEILNGKENIKKKKTPRIIILSMIGIIILLICIQLLPKKPEKFEFKSLSSSNNAFDIKGIIAFSKEKASIYISNVNYKKKEKKINYKILECSLYEKNNQKEFKISACSKVNEQRQTLDEILKKVSFNVDEFKSTCKNFEHNNLYIAIKLLDEFDKIEEYKIPLSIQKGCFDN